MTLDEISILSVYSAMVVYAIAFIAFAIDLARRGAAVTTAADVPARAEAKVAVGAAVDGRPAGRGGAAAVKAAGEASVAYGRSPALRVGVAMTVLAWALHLTADVLRGLAAGRVPWANMYEFALTGTLVITTVFLRRAARLEARPAVPRHVRHGARARAARRRDRQLLRRARSAAAGAAVGVARDPRVRGVGDVGFFALGFALSVVQLLQARREALVASAKAVKLTFLATLPDSATLENLAYRVNIIGFILWTFTLMAGAIWAEKAWGRYWGWDTKEVWTFIIWVVYAGYIHARATRGWRGSRSAWLAIIGFSTVLFNFTVVNLFFKGLHAYSGL